MAMFFSYFKSSSIKKQKNADDHSKIKPSAGDQQSTNIVVLPHNIDGHWLMDCVTSDSKTQFFSVETAKLLTVTTSGWSCHW